MLCCKTLPCSALLVAGLALAGCTKPAERQAAPAQPALDTAAVISQVSNFWQRYIIADTTGNLEAITTMWDDSVRADVRGAPVLLGRAAVRAFIEPIFKTTKYTSMEVTPDMTIPVHNGMAYQNGSYVESSTTAGKSATDYGRYAMALVRGADGQWRIGYLMAFSDSIVSKK
jgi:uncharacterized protein (TIGR02246 family)